MASCEKRAVFGGRKSEMKQKIAGEGEEKRPE